MDPFLCFILVVAAVQLTLQVLSSSGFSRPESDMHGIMSTVRVSLASSDVVASKRTEGELMHISSWWQLKAAPEYWRNLDPSWKHTGPPMRRYFHPDGYHSADPHDAVWGGHECAYTVITSFVGDGQIRDH